MLWTWALSHPLQCAGLSAGLVRPPAKVAFAAHIKSEEPFPVGRYNLPDGVFFLGEEGFGSKLKIRQAI